MKTNYDKVLDEIINKLNGRKPSIHLVLLL